MARGGKQFGNLVDPHPTPSPPHTNARPPATAKGGKKDKGAAKEAVAAAGVEAADGGSAPGPTPAATAATAPPEEDLLLYQEFLPLQLLQFRGQKTLEFESFDAAMRQFFAKVRGGELESFDAAMRQSLSIMKSLVDMLEVIVWWGAGGLTPGRSACQTLSPDVASPLAVAHAKLSALMLPHPWP